MLEARGIPDSSDGSDPNNRPAGSRLSPPLEFHDVPYFEGEGACVEKHKLDVYIPAAPFPRPRSRVCLFVHGGSWQRGDRKHPNVPDHLYGNVGRAFARAGMVGLVISYRLAPDVKHPEQVKDVARAIRWAKENVQRYGGDPGDLVLIGHSAGAHLAALCLSDGRWLMEEGVIPDLKPAPGSSATSGGTRLGAGGSGDGRVSLERDAATRYRTSAPVNVRAQTERPLAGISGFIGISGIYDVPRMAGNMVGRMLADAAFGDEIRIWRRASPLHCVRSTRARMLDNSEVGEEGCVAGAGSIVKASPGAPPSSTASMSWSEEAQKRVTGSGLRSSDATAAAVSTVESDARCRKAERAVMACPLLEVDIMLLTAASDFHLKEDADALAQALEDVRLEVSGTEMSPAPGFADTGSRGPGQGKVVAVPEESASRHSGIGRVQHVCLQKEDHLSVMATFGELGTEATDVVLEFVRNILRPRTKKQAQRGL